VAEDLWFVDLILDDSYENCKGAHGIGWTVAHLVEPSVSLPMQPACEYTIRNLEELRDIFPQCFKSRQVNGSITT
jgi:pyrimidine and pyridine-specific 5'-nucleotidase